MYFLRSSFFLPERHKKMTEFLTCGKLSRYRLEHALKSLLSKGGFSVL